MRNIAREAEDWLRIAHQARVRADEEQDEFSESARTVAGLCEHIAAAMQRIQEIILATHVCKCGECPKPEVREPH